MKVSHDYSSFPFLSFPVKNKPLLTLYLLKRASSSLDIPNQICLIN